MDDAGKKKIFDAIKAFVQDLDDGFSNRYKTIALYNRLLNKMNLNDANLVYRHITAFELFYRNNPEYISEKKLTSNSLIRYSDRILLEMGKILNKCDPAAADAIHKHLVIIYGLINVSSPEASGAADALALLKNKPPNGGLPGRGVPDLNLPDTAEGNFIKETLSEMSTQFEGIGTGGNPMAAMQGMMQTGFFNKYMANLQSKFATGEMNLGSLMNMVTQVIQQTAPPGPEGDEMKKMLSGMVGGSLGGMANMTSQLPPEVKENFDTLLSSLAPSTTTGPSLGIGEVDTEDEAD